ncbi:MAG: GPR endopeptidase [Bacilli bacterium]|nr:GPR endopeptidase [Bacilli bacterium]
MTKLDLNKKYSVRTDLACENGFFKKIKEQASSINKKGIIINKYQDEDSDALYYNIDTRAIKTHDTDDLNNCIEVLSEVLNEIIDKSNIQKNAKCLVVGLGNINVTPDSLGPLVCDNVIVTRHMFITNDEEVSKGISEVSALAPGVMGTTGIETYDIIDAIVGKVDIDFIIVVDALAARSIERVNKTIQITNAGITPGSGVGNSRKELSFKTIGKPIIAIGVPTVVDAVTIANDTIDIIMKYLSEHNPENKEKLFGIIGELTNEDKRMLIDEILTDSGFNMIVTPKEVDIDINDLTHIISGAIDRTLHPLVNNDAS